MIKNLFLSLDWIGAVSSLIAATIVVSCVAGLGLALNPFLLAILISMVVLATLRMRNRWSKPLLGRTKKSLRWLDHLPQVLTAMGLVVGCFGLMMVDQARVMDSASFETRVPTSDIAETAEDIDFTEVQQEIERYNQSSARARSGRERTEQGSSFFKMLGRYKLQAFVTLCVGVLLVILGGVIERTRELRS